MVGVVRIFRRESAQAILVWLFPSRCQRVPPMENHNLHLQAPCPPCLRVSLLILCQARTIRNPYPQMASRSVVFLFCGSVALASEAWTRVA